MVSHPCLYCHRVPVELRPELRSHWKACSRKQPPVIKWGGPGEHPCYPINSWPILRMQSSDKLLLAMAESVVGITPFVLETRQLGEFPSIDASQVIWVGVNAIGIAGRLRDNIEKNTECSASNANFRPFSPQSDTWVRVRDGRPHLTETFNAIGKLINETTFNGFT